MSCISEETKKKFLSVDPYQTPKRQEASALGLFNAYVVLPVGVLVYAILLKTVLNPIESETEMIVTKDCTPFNFTCTTKWGCEVAAMGKKTTALFSKKNISLFLKQGERMNESICPGLSEGLDIAPRAAVWVNDDIHSSFEHNGIGYFGGQNGIVYQVNLTNMRLVNRSMLGGYLNTGFTDGGYGFFGSYNGVLYKINLKTLALVKSVELHDIITTGFSYKRHGYFGVTNYNHDFNGVVTTVNLISMEIVENRKHISHDDFYASAVGYDHYGYFGGFDKKIYQVNLTTLTVTKSTPVRDKLWSVYSIEYGLLWGTNLGKVLYYDCKSYHRVRNSWDLKKGAITTLAGYYAGTGSNPAHVVKFGGTPGDLTLTGVDSISTGFQKNEYLYYGSHNGYIIKINTTVDRGFNTKPRYPTMGDPIGRIYQSNPLDFPQEDDIHSTYSLFSTDTEIKMKNTRTIEYLYQSMHVHDFKDKPCKTIQPDYLCRRINLAPTQLHVTKRLKYNMALILPICVSVASFLFAVLRQVTKRAPQVYNKLCKKRKIRRTSTVELLTPEYTQM